jgi:hypothetical protein
MNIKLFFILFFVTYSYVYGQIDTTEIAFTPTSEKASNLDVEQQPKNYTTAIRTAFQQGNASKISVYFADNIELSLHDKTTLYSKSQAHQILKTFFIGDKPVKFTIIHEGSKQQNNYWVGILVTESNKKYRVTINSKRIKNVDAISSVAIEES